MLINFFTVAATAAFVTAIFLLHYEVFKPVREEHRKGLRDQWIDFISDNINGCTTLYHCYQCRKMISLFEARFKKHTPPHLYYSYVELLSKRLDLREKCIAVKENAISQFTSEDTQNFFQ